MLKREPGLPAKNIKLSRQPRANVNMETTSAIKCFIYNNLACLVSFLSHGNKSLGGNATVTLRSARASTGKLIPQKRLSPLALWVTGRIKLAADESILIRPTASVYKICRCAQIEGFMPD